MENEPSQINPWVRANWETVDPGTLDLIPPAYRNDYLRIQKERQHWKATLGLALDRVVEIQGRVADNDSELSQFMGLMTELHSRHTNNVIQFPTSEIPPKAA